MKIESIRDYIDSFTSDLCYNLGIEDSGAISGLSHAINQEVLNSVPSGLDAKNLKVYDVNNNKQAVVIWGHQAVVIDAMLELVRARQKGYEGNIDDILLHSDKRYMVFDNNAYPVQDMEVAMFVQNTCKMRQVAELLSGGATFGVTLYGDSINVLKQYLLKAKHIKNTKYTVLNDVYTIKELDNISFELNYISKQLVSCTQRQLVEFAKQHHPSLDTRAKELNIFSPDLIYRVKQGMSVDNAIELGIYERDKYQLDYCYSIWNLGSCYIPNIDKILENIIKELIALK